MRNDENLGKLLLVHKVSHVAQLTLLSPQLVSATSKNNYLLPSLTGNPMDKDGNLDSRLVNKNIFAICIFTSKFGNLFIWKPVSKRYSSYKLR